MTKYFKYLPTKEYLPSMIATSILGVLLFTILSYTNGSNSSVAYAIEPWLWGAEYITFFLPLIVVIPFSYILYGKLKNQFYLYANIREVNHNFIKLEIIKTMIATGFTMFLIYFISLVIVILGMDFLINTSNSELIKNPFGELQINIPIKFGFLWCIWIGFITSLVSLFASIITLITENYFIATLTPFLYFFIENLVTALLGIPQYSIYTSVYLNRLSYHVMESYYYLYGVGTLVLVLLSLLMLTGIKRSDRYDR